MNYSKAQFILNVHLLVSNYTSSRGLIGIYNLYPAMFLHTFCAWL